MRRSTSKREGETGSACPDGAGRVAGNSRPPSNAAPVETAKTPAHAGAFAFVTEPVRDGDAFLGDGLADESPGLFDLCWGRAVAGESPGAATCAPVLVRAVDETHRERFLADEDKNVIVLWVVAAAARRLCGQGRQPFVSCHALDGWRGHATASGQRPRESRARHHARSARRRRPTSAVRRTVRRSSRAPLPGTSRRGA